MEGFKLKDEFAAKLGKIREFLEKNSLDGIHLSRRDNFSWITCGANNWVLKSTGSGFADVLITENRHFIIASEVERYRIFDEEVAGLGFELIGYNWYEERESIIEKMAEKAVIASDTGVCGTREVSGPFSRLRYTLLPDEVLRLREVCKITSTAVNDVCHEIHMGDTEYEIAAKLDYKLMKSGVQAPVCMVAADDRIKKYRHPIPTAKKVSKYALVVAGAEKYGLFASVSRMVGFGRPEEEIIKRHEACMKLDAGFIRNTVVGAKVSDILKSAIDKYRECGYPEEWMLHHQGGATGYQAREYIATPDSNEIVQENQAFSWNPTITGTKCEDTYLITVQGQEILTDMGGWPMARVDAGDCVMLRPDILAR